MAIAAVSRPFRRLMESSCLEPSSTRPTSLTRTVEPSGLARTTICSNSAASVSRPWVCRLIWNCWSSVIGWAPMRPTAACTFCARMALITSVGVSPSAVSWSDDSQMRML